MLKVDDYLRHAEECRRQAAAAVRAHVRDALLEMSAAWEELARQRRQLVEKRQGGDSWSSARKSGGGHGKEEAS